MSSLKTLQRLKEGLVPLSVPTPSIGVGVALYSLFGGIRWGKARGLSRRWREGGRVGKDNTEICYN